MSTSQARSVLFGNICSSILNKIRVGSALFMLKRSPLWVFLGHSFLIQERTFLQTVHFGCFGPTSNQDRPVSKAIHFRLPKMFSKKILWSKVEFFYDFVMRWIENVHELLQTVTYSTITNISNSLFVHQWNICSLLMFLSCPFSLMGLTDSHRTAIVRPIALI